jgi:GTP cyclohydrolase I
VNSRTDSIRQLPDVAFDAAALARPLDWVGMSNIALPLRVASGNETITVPASVDVSVDLRDANARGIHMSRLYLELQHAFASEVVTPAGLRRVLQTLVDTQGGLSTRARLVLRYEHLMLRRALASEHAGWKRYPVEIDASLIDGHLRLGMRFSVEYSSTCPASAALSRGSRMARFGTWPGGDAARAAQPGRSPRRSAAGLR